MGVDIWHSSWMATGDIRVSGPLSASVLPGRHRCLSPCWAPGFHSAQPQRVQVSDEWTKRCEIYVCTSVSLPVKKWKLRRKTSLQFCFAKTDNLVLKHLWKFKGSRIAKTILEKNKIVTLSIPKLNTELRPEYANLCGTDIQRYSAWLTTFHGKRGVFFNKESG